MRTVAIGISSLLGGSVIGYLLFVPVLAIPMESGMPILLPLLKKFYTFASNFEAEYVATAFTIFLLHLPNTVFLAGVSAAALRILPLAKRLAIYSVFLVPVFIYGSYWFEVWRLKEGASRLGLPNSIDRLPTDLNIGFKVVLILLTYGLFTVMLFGLLKVKHKRAATHA